MKKFVFLGLISLGLSLFIVKGQDSKYGQDSINCLKNLSTMHEFCKIDLYSYAWNSWLYTFNECPAASKNIYIYGAKIVKDFIEKDSDARKYGLIDTLMLLYDRRIEYFGQKGYVLGRKGIDLLKYDNSRIEEAYAYLKESVNLTRGQAEAAVLVTYMMASVNLSSNSLISCEDVVGDFSIISGIIDQQIKKDPNDDKVKLAKENIDNLFSNGICSDCSTLIALFEPQFEKNKENIDFLKNTTDLLLKKNCENEDFFALASETLYPLEPSASSAYNLAKLFINRKEYNKASKYLTEAIEFETDNEKKSSYLYQLATIEYTESKDYKKVRDYALKAISLTPDWGDPYILIGKVYAAAASECAETDFDKNAIYWLAVDKFIKAKTVDENVKGIANELIEKYSVYFPNKEEIFFQGKKEGDIYEVGCWINEKTTVRINN